MGVRTGRQYLERLAHSNPEIYIDGARLDAPVPDHPRFRATASSIAKTFDLQHDAEHHDAMTFTSPSSGNAVSASFIAPRGEQDLAARREAIMSLTSFTHGFLGHAGGYMNTALAALAQSKQFFAQADPVFGERIESYAEYVRENDLFTAHALVPPQSNRAAPSPDEQGDGRIAARVVEERPDGIVVRGARMLATLAPLADELVVFPSTALKGAPQDAPYSYAFAIPTDTEGLRFYCRSAMQQGESLFDEPLGARFEEHDAFVVFDDVFVPNERVFMLGHARLRNEWYSATGAGALMTHHAACRSLAKTEFYLGLAAEIVDAIGINQFAHIQSDLGELIVELEVHRALVRASEADGALNEDGLFLPRWSTLNAFRNWYPLGVSQRYAQIIRKLSASGLMALPSEADLHNSHERPDLDRYLQGARVDAETRIRLFKLALDASVSSFSGRESLSEQFFFGDPVRMKASLATGYDLAPARGRVRELLNRD